MAVINRDPRTTQHATREDVLLALAVTAQAVVLALVTDPTRRPDALGWVLLLAAQLPIVWRRRHPLPALAAEAVLLLPYHALDNNHTAPLPVSVVVLYSLAVTCRPLYTLLATSTAMTVALTVMMVVNKKQATEALRISGWVIAVVFIGIALRLYRQYVAAVVERAERAERTREQEVRRRVAEERLRIARDLHDLLAHSITLIGVQTSVAAHILNADPERLDRQAVAKSLDDIAETCRTARGELRTTLEVLREHDTRDARDPLPDLHGLAGLVAAARVSGAEVDLTVTDEVPPAAVGAAAYRIVQEALTNAVRHSGRQGLSIRVGVRAGEGSLWVTVTDDGTGTGGGTPGFGLIGMRERARSVGGTLDARPLPGKGFEVSAVLPLGGNP
ncbi:sensor histidine kinase [Streptomyces sp. NBC_01244]|uniref:sensor histidine kinase n=1 Tax=Streptomyces sp. NBC_01244 TaxID=2903797 RepID=UPI002E153B70|nr:histidine kinase [Streptomyces sp. NBC_01244]